MTKVRPLNDRVLVKRMAEEEKTAGGLFIPDAAKEKPARGIVIAVGQGKSDDTGKRTVGSLYLLHTRSLARAREIIENDPFFKAGAFASVEYFPHLPAAGRYIGGTIW